MAAEAGQPSERPADGKPTAALGGIPLGPRQLAAWMRRIEELAEQAEQLEAAGGPVEEVVDLWMHIALRHPDPVAQGDCYRRVLALRPEEPRALEALAGLQEQAGDWEDAARLLSKLADSTDEPGRRVELEHRAGQILWQRLADDERAEAHFLHAFALREPHMPSVIALVQIYRERGDWEGAAELLVRSEARVLSKSLRLELLMEAANIHRDHVTNPRAEELLESALAIDPGHLPAINALADIYRRERRWEEAEAFVEVLEHDDAESATRVRSRLETARAVAEEALLDESPTGLADACATERDAARASQRGPTQPEELSAVEIVFEDDQDQTNFELQLGDADVDEVIEEARAKLLENPRHSKSYRVLRAALTKQGRYDPAWCLCATMAYLGYASPREREYYETYKPRRVAQKLTLELWDRVVHPTMDPRVAVIANAIGRELASMHARSLRHHGLRPGNRRDIDNDQLALSRALERAATLLDVPFPDLYLEPNEPGELSLENTVHRGQLSPSLVARGDALSGRTPSELACIAGHALAFLRPDFFLAVAFATDAELLAAWEAALALARPGASLGSGGSERAVVDRARASLDKALSSRARAELALAVNGSGLSFDDIDVAAWREAVDVTAQRIGLVLCGDAAVAARTLASSTAKSLPRATETDQLLLYSVSEDYFAVRMGLGGTIDADQGAERAQSAT